jgi:pyochelin biosynthetic protein PchC
MTTDRTRWLGRFRPAPSAPTRLVCFPHAGGSASYYRPVAVAMSPEVDVFAVQYPGRQDRHREPLVDNLTTLADTLADVLDDRDDRPTAFFGHSMGAILAFEVARRMERRGIRLAGGLFVSGRPAPTVIRERYVHLMAEPDLIAEVKGLSGTDSRLLDDDEVVSMVLPALRGDYKAIETYRYPPGPDVTCEVVVLFGDQDPMVTAAEAEQWRRHTTGPFSTHVYPGGHFYLDVQHRAVNRLIAEHLATTAAEADGMISSRRRAPAGRSDNAPVAEPRRNPAG